ncbi:MAG: hypothetical protein ACLVJH_08365 [Faecalibacterium prausnitzii]
MLDAWNSASGSKVRKQTGKNRVLQYFCYHDAGAGGGAVTSAASTLPST